MMFVHRPDTSCYEPGMRILGFVTLLGLVASPVHADDAVYTCKARGANEKISVSFAPETSLQDLATWTMGFTCKNIVIDAEAVRYGAKVTIMAPKPMTPKAALELFKDAVESTGLVVQIKKDTIVVKLGKNTPLRSCVADASGGGSSMPTTTLPTPTTSADDEALSRAIDEGVKKLSDTSYEIKSGLLDKVLANPMGVAKGARVVPAIKDGKPDGFKLYAIRPTSLYAKMGLLNGDTLQTINGLDLTSADKALDAYTKIRDATKIEVKLLRRGTPVTLTYTIK
jgi:hypothetical protein